MPLILLRHSFTVAIIIILAITITPEGTVANTGVNTISLFWMDLFGKDFLKLLIVLSGAILAVKAGGILIGMAVKPFLDEIRDNENYVDKKINPSSRGFKNGGKVIGQLAGIGFLIAAKSVFRFGEIKDPQHRMEAEYIIIGTLMSFGYGMLTAYATKYFLGQV